MTRLEAEVETLGPEKWRGLLRYVARLHSRSIRTDRLNLFPHPWEEIGSGYHFGPAFGHWDICHACFDTVPSEPHHAARQMDNLFALQQPDGRMPVVMMLRNGEPHLHKPTLTHPPVWPTVIDALAERGVDRRPVALDVALRQLAWFDAHRNAGDGYAYADLAQPDSFESGIDDGIRFLDVDTSDAHAEPLVDASCHVWLLIDAIARWSGDDVFRGRADQLAAVVRETMWCDRLGFFFDPLHLRRGDPPASFEGIWPLALGIASNEQANRVIDDWLLRPDRLFGSHPLRTVAASDAAYEPRMWRGPAWNSMTLWAAIGCTRYGRHDAAVRLATAALDGSAAQFDRTGTIFEYYDPDGGPPEDLARKPYHPDQNTPSTDYLGHNPLIALARLAVSAKPHVTGTV
ncbi:MAG: trehalase family glycosidase [Planctomycetota bacterium]